MKARRRLELRLRACALGACSVLWLLQLASGCGQSVEVGRDDALSVGASSSGSGGGAPMLAGASPGSAGDGQPEAGAPGCTVTYCRNKRYQCGDCLDNDSDGLSDQLDPDCLGPCDDDEAALSTGLSVGQAAACRQDCYFDGDAGPGNDQCEWNHRCDPLSVPPDYPPSGEERCAYDSTGASMGVECDALMAEQAPTCREGCFPLVPNGCDCFGCCLLPDGDYHFLGSSRGPLGCQLDTPDDAVACPRCTPVPSCLNTCDECETCIGHERDPSCSDDLVCPAGQAACDSDAPCDYQEYCVTGCCVRAPKPT